MLKATARSRPPRAYRRGRWRRWTEFWQAATPHPVPHAARAPLAVSRQHGTARQKERAAIEAAIARPWCVPRPTVVAVRTTRTQAVLCAGPTVVAPAVAPVDGAAGTPIVRRPVDASVRARNPRSAVGAVRTVRTQRVVGANACAAPTPRGGDWSQERRKAAHQPRWVARGRLVGAATAVRSVPPSSHQPSLRSMAPPGRQSSDGPSMQVFEHSPVARLS